MYWSSLSWVNLNIRKISRIAPLHDCRIKISVSKFFAMALDGKHLALFKCFVYRICLVSDTSNLNFSSMPLKEKRKYYACGDKYVTSDDLPRWDSENEIVNPS